MFFIFFVSALAETNRHPFDLPEAQAELVFGHNVEYSVMGFALFFLGEYANMLLMSSLTTILFFWLPSDCFRQKLNHLLGSLGSGSLVVSFIKFTFLKCLDVF